MRLDHQSASPAFPTVFMMQSMELANRVRRLEEPSFDPSPPIHSLNEGVWPVYYVTVMTTCAMMMTTRDHEERGNTSLAVAVSSKSEERTWSEKRNSCSSCLF